MSILENLNENQKKAVLHTDGPLLILAGAGSGKTRVITHRIAHLVGEKRIPPTAIFAVTFTNKATEEMKNRIIKLIGPQGSSVFIKTFHAAAVYILRRYGDRIGIPKSFSIYDTSDQATLIKEILLQMRLDPKKIRPESIASKISEVKDKAELIDGTDPEQLTQKTHFYDFQEIYDEYHRLMAKNNALDFNDLLIKTVQLLRSDSDALERLQRQWSYFMIDEYQDTNYAQYLIAKYLASASKNICVVGDDDQSIYSWRGADIRNILNFEKDYLGAAVITLERNYRSRQPILTAASSVIRNNVNRKEKNLDAHKGEGEPVVWCKTNNEYGEAEYVVNTIMSLKHRENLANSDFAIFYRTNAQSRVFEDRLRKENIPYRLVGGMKFYERKEIKDILAYLKFIVNPLDLVSMLRIINTPSRGIGRVTIDKIRDHATRGSETEWDVIRENRLGEKLPKGLVDFRDIIMKCQESAREVPRTKLSDFMNQVLELSGYMKSLEDEDTMESHSRLENISELMNSVYDYEQAQPEATLDQFLQDISLYTSEENPEENPENRINMVTLMTVHNAKGLEYPVVFLTGMEEDIFPHRLSSDSEEGIEEERRLCYVGITRAMERVYVTSAELRRTFHEIFHKEPSRFIFEIPTDLIEVQEFISTGFQNGPSYRNPFNVKKTYTESHFDDQVDDTELVEDPADQAASGGRSDSKFKIRDNVLHPKYGVGRVLSIEGSGDNVKLTILFGRSSKTFLEKYTPLEKAE
jgi:DNA helicase II / ATP-dependent DNA helicase PcrA